MTPRAAESDNTGPVAVLYRLRVKETEARIEASRDLEGRFGSLRVIGDRAFYLRLGLDGCDESALSGIALDGDLSAVESVPLPGAEWRMVDDAGEYLLVAGPNDQGYAVFDVEDGAPKLETYAAGALSPALERRYGLFPLAGEI